MEEMISVVVVTYNQEKTIARTLDSILCQRCHLPIEIVIGEDGFGDFRTEGGSVAVWVRAGAFENLVINE